MSALIRLAVDGRELVDLLNREITAKQAFKIYLHIANEVPKKYHRELLAQGGGTSVHVAELGASTSGVQMAGIGQSQQFVKWIKKN